VPAPKPSSRSVRSLRCKGAGRGVEREFDRSALQILDSASNLQVSLSIKPAMTVQSGHVRFPARREWLVSSATQAPMPRGVPQAIDVIDAEALELRRRSRCRMRSAVVGRDDNTTRSTHNAIVSFTITDAAHWNQLARSQPSVASVAGEVLWGEPYSGMNRGLKLRGRFRFAETTAGERQSRA
jgi:hypothetical protein